MWGIAIVLILAMIIFSISLPEILGVLDGNQTSMGLPAGFTGITFLLGFIFTIISGSILTASFFVFQEQKRRRKRR